MFDATWIATWMDALVHLQYRKARHRIAHRGPWKHVEACSARQMASWTSCQSQRIWT